jgi:predicted DNA-binding WGR domain protein
MIEILRASVLDGSPVRMVSIDPAENRARFYEIQVCPNLFGEWSIVRQWGRIGKPCRLRVDLCVSAAEAEKRAAAILKRRVRRRYAFEIDAVDADGHEVLCEMSA